MAKKKKQRKPNNIGTAPPVDLKQLAVDIFEGRVFTDRHCRTEDDVRRSFLAFLLMDAKTARAIKKQNPSMIYEYMKYSLPRAINGNPCFLSFHMLDEGQHREMEKHLRALKEQRKEFLNEKP